MITLTIHFDNADSAAQVLELVKRLRDTSKDNVAKATEAIEKAAALPTAKATPEMPKVKPPKSEQPAAEKVEPVAAPTGTTADSAPTAEITYDDVAAIVIKFSKANGRPAAVEAMKPFGITSLTQAKPEQYAAIAKALS